MELFERSLATLIGSWVYLASGSPGAGVRRIEGAAIGPFVHRPDREFLNNAVLERRPADFDATLAEIEATYARHRIEEFAVWVHESDATAATALHERGYRFDSATRTMAMSLDGLAGGEPTAADPPAAGDPSGASDLSALEVVEATPAEFWAVEGPAGLVPELDPSGAHFYVARLEGESAAMLMAFDHDCDCGIYMVGTVEVARRRGVATALSAHAVSAARKRGCLSVSLQATEMAERVYARVGFRDLGRWGEYVPAETVPAA